MSKKIDEKKYNADMPTHGRINVEKINKIKELCGDTPLTLTEFSEVNNMDEAAFVHFMMTNAAALGRSRMHHENSHKPVHFHVRDEDADEIISVTVSVHTKNQEEFINKKLDEAREQKH